MGSVGNQNPWAPFDNYRDCSQGICSSYCPQFCSLIFPPPPYDDDSDSPFSPLIIAIIGVLVSAFLLVSYYTIVTRYCRGRGDHNSSLENEENRDELSPDQWQTTPSGLDEALIKTITICKYKKSDGLIEGTECAVCLSEFQENESLRLLPKCSHAFHLPCIDTWLKSQSNCPLCRANVIALVHPVHNSQASPSVNSDSYQVHRPSDLVLVVDNQQHTVVSILSDENVTPKRNESVQEPGGDNFRRSSSVASQRQLLVSDILKFEEIDEYVQLESDHLWRGIGSSKGFSEESKSSVDNLLRSPVAMRRSFSTDRFMFTLSDKGKNSILPS